jgi:hypothetical protein
MLAAYYTAAVPAPFRVFGRSLLPFSVGHEILFKASSNNFSMDAEKPPNFGDLLMGVWMCSRQYSECVKSLFHHRRMAAWFAIVSRCFRGEEELESWLRYLKHYRSFPDFSRKGTGQRCAIGAPFEQILKVFLMETMHMSPEDALNYPYSWAMWDYLTHLEQNGAVFLIDSMEELEAQAKAFQEEIFKKACR